MSGFLIVGLAAVAAAVLLGAWTLELARDLGGRALEVFERLATKAVAEEFDARRSAESHAQYLERVAKGRRGPE